MMTIQQRLHKIREAIKAGKARITQIQTFNKKRHKQYQDLKAQRQPKTQEGYDYAYGHLTAAQVKAAGRGFVCRYLSGGSSKDITHDEIKALRGVSVVLVWETTGTRASAGEAAGRSDGKMARSQARALGVPDSAVIYYAVDWDADPASVLPYFKGVSSAEGPTHCGPYGGVRVVKAILDSGLCKFAWQTSAWSSGQWDSRAQLQQYDYGKTVDGVGVDYDRSTAANYGQFTP